MEEMKETERKMNWKWLLVIPIIIVGIITLTYGFYVNNPGLQVVSTTTVHNTETTTQQSVFTTSGRLIREERVTSFPTKIEIELDSMTKYVATVNADGEIGFVIWTTGEHPWNIAGHPDTTGRYLKYDIYTDSKGKGTYVFEFPSTSATYADFTLYETMRVST